MVGDLSLERGASALMQATGVGKLAPNVVLMGYKTEWASCNNRKELQEYFNVLQFVQKPFKVQKLNSLRKLADSLLFLYKQQRLRPEISGCDIADASGFEQDREWRIRRRGGSGHRRRGCARPEQLQLGGQYANARGQ